MYLYDRIVNRDLLIRRLNISTNHVIREDNRPQKMDKSPQQLDLFTDYESAEKTQKNKQKELEKERRMQEAVIKIKQRFGKNAILKGTSYAEGATAKERNKQIGGHRA